MGEYEHATLEMVYAELKKLNQKMITLEQLIIPEEKMSAEDLKELDEAIADAKKGNTTPFSKIRK